MVVSPRQSASVSDVDRMTRTLTARLEAADVPRGAVVALTAPNGPGFLAGLLAIRRHGAAALLIDWRTPAAEKTRIAEALRVAATLDCRRAWPRDVHDFTLRSISTRSASVPPETAVVKLTSGSTGCPRGILTPSSALVADEAALAATMQLRPDERILTAIPMSHSYGLSSTVMPALMRRGLLVVAENAGRPLDPIVAARAHGVTFFPTAPAFLQAVVKMAKPPRLPRSLRLVVSAGGPLRPATAVAFRQAYGLPVHVFYGASECGGIAFDRTGTAGERGTVGTLVEGVDVTLEPVDGHAGAAQVVAVESSAVASGYAPDPDPSFGGGRFRTHDLGSWQDGELALEGRLDDLINMRGRKINPREVERILGKLDGVEDVVVLGVTPPGRDEAVVRSYIVSGSDAVTRASVQAWCRRHLASYKIPRSIVWLDEIPRTARGKPDKAALLTREPGFESPPREKKLASHG